MATPFFGHITRFVISVVPHTPEHQQQQLQPC